MKTAFLYVAVGLAALALAGCGGPKAGGVNSASHPVTVQKIGNAQELGDVVSLLDQGDEKGARKKLDVMVKRDPSDVRSKALLDTLSADPAETLGAKSFDYRVEPADTMQSIAQHFLGDRMKFYLLARYNKIALPAGLRPGQIIRVPGEAPAPRPLPVRPRTESTPPPTPARPTPKASPVKPADPAAPATNTRRAAQLRAAGLAALNKGQVGQAVGLLSQARAVDPSNVLIQRDLERAQRIQETVRARK